MLKTVFSTNKYNGVLKSFRSGKKIFQKKKKNPNVWLYWLDFIKRVRPKTIRHILVYMTFIVVIEIFVLWCLYGYTLIKKQTINGF